MVSWRWDGRVEIELHPRSHRAAMATMSQRREHVERLPDEASSLTHFASTARFFLLPEADQPVQESFSVCRQRMAEGRSTEFRREER
jgi:hypothetical protein